MLHPPQVNPRTNAGAGTGTDLLPHGCKDPQQDAMHGTGMRVMNRASGPSWHCTTCGGTVGGTGPKKAS